MYVTSIVNVQIYNINIKLLLLEKMCGIHLHTDGYITLKRKWKISNWSGNCGLFVSMAKSICKVFNAHNSFPTQNYEAKQEMLI